MVKVRIRKGHKHHVIETVDEKSSIKKTYREGDLFEATEEQLKNHPLTFERVHENEPEAPKVEPEGGETGDIGTQTA